MHGAQSEYYWASSAIWNIRYFRCRKQHNCHVMTKLVFVGRKSHGLIIGLYICT